MKVTLLMALTLDGKIAKNANQLVDWTEKADKKMFVEITREAGCLIMGSQTFDTIGGALPGRKNIIMTRNRSRRSNDENLIFTDRPPKRLIAELESQGYDHVVLVGGAIVNALFGRENLIDEIVLTVSPLIFGCGLPLFDGALNMDLDLLAAHPFGENSIHLRYRVIK